MIIDHGDNALPLSFNIGDPLVVRDIVPYSVSYTFRTGGISPETQNLVKFVEKVLR
jgi:hypothetical protein